VLSEFFNAYLNGDSVGERFVAKSLMRKTRSRLIRIRSGTFAEIEKTPRFHESDPTKLHPIATNGTLRTARTGYNQWEGNSGFF
jgi:hypothetical protein